MSKVLVDVVDEFIHGTLKAKRGQKGLPMWRDLAEQLQDAGLVVITGEADAAITTLPHPPGPLKGTPAKTAAASGKAPAAGEALTSSSLPAAPASPRKTSKRSSDGVKTPQRRKDDAAA